MFLFVDHGQTSDAFASPIAAKYRRTPQIRDYLFAEGLKTHLSNPEGVGPRGLRMRRGFPMGKPSFAKKKRGKPWEIHGKTMGKAWESGNIIGKLLENT